MLKNLLIAALPVLALLAIPLLLRPGTENAGNGAKKHPSSNPAAEKLVIISAHNESIRYEYEQAFRRYYREKFGREIELDFRSPGGTSDIVRYIADRFEAEFRRYFESDPANGEWTDEIAAAFANPRTDTDPTASPAAKRARALFLASDVGIGIDLMAGGGTFDMARHAARGYAVDAGVKERHPELLSPELIPPQFGGDNLYDPQGRYYGVVLSTFGICYNRDRVAELSDPTPPAAWRDLGQARFFNTLVLADPSKSGSANKCFEIIIQQCMSEAGSPEKGWERGLNLIKQLFKGFPDINGDYLAPRDHDLPRRPVIKCEHGIDHLTLVILKCACFISHLKQCLDFFLSNCFLLVFRLHSEDPQNKFRGDGEQFDHRRQHHRYIMDRHDCQHAERLRFLQCDPFRNKLTENKVEKHQHQCYPVVRNLLAVRDPDPLHPLCQYRRDACRSRR